VKKSTPVREDAHARSFPDSGRSIRTDIAANLFPRPVLLLPIVLLLAGHTAGAGTCPLPERGAPPAEENVERAAGPERTSLEETITLQITQSIDLVLEHLSASIRALGEEYVRLYLSASPMGPAERSQWLDRSRTENETTVFLALPSAPEPPYQAPLPGYFVYGPPESRPGIWRELEVLSALAPSFKITHDTFDYSWVYLTTVNEVMTIYPYLTSSEAAHNHLPTEQVFFRAADFENRTFGWTKPYLDLVGAGMMVTVSYPLYHDNDLLGVVSRDITLNQLSTQVLTPVSEDPRDLVSIIVDRDGLAIASSDVADMKEIDTVNSRARSAVLHYRTEDGAEHIRSGKAVRSSSELNNRACEGVLARVREKPDAGLWQSAVSLGRVSFDVTAAQVAGTGWLVVTLSSPGSTWGAAGEQDMGTSRSESGRVRA